MMLDQTEILRLVHSMRTLLAMPHARANSDDAHNIGNGGWETMIYENEEYDDAGEYDHTTGEFTAARGGRLHIDAAVVFDNTTAWVEGEQAILAVFIDGAQKATLDWEMDESATNHKNDLGGGTTIEVSAGEVITIKVYQDSGAARTLRDSGLDNYVNFDWLP